MTNEEIKNRIKKLLALSEDDGAADAEAESALRFARRLMLKHEIDEAQLNEAKDVHEAAADEEYSDEQVASVGSSLTHWEGLVAWAVVKLVGTVKHYRGGGFVERREEGRAVINPVTGRVCRAVPLIFYGPAHDVADATTMYREWVATILALARMKWGGALRGPGRSYCEGFAQALLNKVYKINKEEQAALPEHTTSQQWALVVQRAADLVVAKRERATTWLKEERGIELRGSGRNSGYGEHHGGAYKDGASDGSKADVSRRNARRLTNG